MTLVAEFLKHVQSTYATGQATEHSFIEDFADIYAETLARPITCLRPCP